MLLHPLARILVNQGVTLGAATEALKVALIEAAAQEAGADVSDSRVSLRTGLHRKDVRRLRHSAAGPARKSTMNALTLVLNQWCQSAAFLTPDGEPIELTRRGDHSQPGFDDLVKAARIDLASGTVLAELLEQGLVREQANGTLRLVSRAYIPGSGATARLGALEATVASHLDTAAQNFLSAPGEKRHFDRAVRYSRLSQGSLAELELEARDGAQQLLERINLLAFRLQQADEEKEEPATGRFGLGAFVYSSEDDKPRG